MTYGLEEELEEKELTHILRDLEIPLASVLTAMEECGIAIDVQALRELSHGMESEIEELASAIHTHAGGPFNIKSPKQLGIIRT